MQIARGAKLTIALSAEPAAGCFLDRLQTSVVALPIEDYALIGDTQTAALGNFPQALSHLA